MVQRLRNGLAWQFWNWVLSWSCWPMSCVASVGGGVTGWRTHFKGVSLTYVTCSGGLISSRYGPLHRIAWVHSWHGNQSPWDVTSKSVLWKPQCLLWSSLENHTLSLSTDWIGGWTQGGRDHWTTVEVGGPRTLSWRTLNNQTNKRFKCSWKPFTPHYVK